MEQGDIVRKLKEEKADAVTIKAAVTELKARIKALDVKVSGLICSYCWLDGGKGWLCTQTNG